MIIQFNLPFFLAMNLLFNFLVLDRLNVNIKIKVFRTPLLSIETCIGSQHRAIIHN